ncbi:MAG TPA: Gfo/Idh/MocA family oxidoreductase [Candidatus Limnocylindrales bacterium]
MRFGLLGTGYWAREVHGAALARHPGVELAGVWGRDAAKAEALGAALGVPPKGFEELVKSVDAVAIALPPDIQAELATRAARAGCHLLLDKPLALTVEAADRLVAETGERGLASVVFFTNLFQPDIVAALEKATATGGWLGGRTTFFGSIYTEGSPYAGSVWRREYGGLWDIGPHALSLLCPVLGQVVEVTAMSGPRQTAYVTMRHETGAVSTMETTLDAALPATRFEAVLHGESGWVTLPGFDGDATSSFGRAITQLIESVGGPEHPLSVRFGRHVVAVLAAAEESARTGRASQLGA